VFENYRIRRLRQNGELQQELKNKHISDIITFLTIIIHIT